ncbi:MAG: M48 family metallopeptidase [Elusimicrobiota bacterium]
MNPPLATPLLWEVREFLLGLRRDWPEIFSPRRPTPSVPAQIPGDRPRIAAPAPDAPLKSSVPQGDLAALFRSRAEFWAPALGVDFGRVRVKDQRTLWGSCSRAGNLSFNWRLALAPDEVLDYLVVHELAHRAHMNHSRRFWEFVERVCPEHRAHRRWLRQNARALYRAERGSERDMVIRSPGTSAKAKPESHSPAG